MVWAETGLMGHHCVYMEVCAVRCAYNAGSRNRAVGIMYGNLSVIKHYLFDFVFNSRRFASSLLISFSSFLSPFI